jgi:NADPH-dependent curcumin reductase CurA
VQFDNTGGDILGSALFRMNKFGRIVCCGNVSQYDKAKGGASPRGIPGLLVNNQVKMQVSRRSAKCRIDRAGQQCSGDSSTVVIAVQW